MKYSEIEREYLRRFVVAASLAVVEEFHRLHKEIESMSVKEADRAECNPDEWAPEFADWQAAYDKTFDEIWQAVWDSEASRRDQPRELMSERADECGFIRAARDAAEDLAFALLAARKAGCWSPADDAESDDDDMECRPQEEAPSRYSIRRWLEA